MTRACLGNRIGAEGMKSVAEALRVNQTVAQLDLKRKCLNDNGEERLGSTDVAESVCRQ